MITPSLSACLAQIRALADFLDFGEGRATLVFYEDEKPANINSEVNTDKILAVLELPKPCFRRLNADGVELQPTTDVLASKTGVAVWARLFSSSGEAVADLEMGIDIILNSYEIALGATQRLDSIILKPYLG